MSIAKTPPTQIGDQTAEETAIRAVVQRLSDGWNRRDSQLFASAFAETHDYVAFNGFQMLGQSREANANVHDQIWQTTFAEGSEISITITQIRFLTPAIAVAHASSTNDYTANGEARELDGSFTIVLTKIEGEGWVIEAFHAGKKENSFTGHLDDQ
jgi:uncharacterized protein (TIGR02246 family)